MEKIVFTEEFCSPENLFPFTLTRQVQDIRIGIFTIREKWEQYLNLPSFDKFEDDYKDLDRAIIIEDTIGDDIFYLVHGNVLPTAGLIQKVKSLKPGSLLSVPERESLVYCISKEEVQDENKIRVQNAVEVEEEVKEIRYPWDLFRLNGWAISQDMELVRLTRKQGKLSETNRVTAPENIFVEEGARVEHCFINAEEGPVFIGKGALVMEGSMLRGPLAICEGAVVKMGAKLYGATTIGPYCTAGGEIKNSIFFEYSNKAHDGYIGDSVIGAWCNMGAGTSGSNVKNTASDVSVWTPKGPITVGKKCGLLMGDYSRTAINTSLNTGTVVGVCSHIAGQGLLPKYIPSFSWGGDGIERYDLQKAYRDIANWKAFKGAEVTQNERTILKHIFDYY